MMDDKITDGENVENTLNSNEMEDTKSVIKIKTVTHDDNSTWE